MGLKSFKELLLKKSVGNKALSTFVDNIENDFLAAQIIEALEKMARPTHNMGAKVSGPVATYAANLDRSDVMQLRDALSHHVSHYKAALKAHHAATDKNEKERLRTVADQHLNHLIPLMHLAARAGEHSNDKLALDYPPVAAWETNYTTLDRRPETGKFIHDNKKLGRRPAAGARQWSSENPNNRGVKDYHYLEMAPHPGHDHFATMPHEGGYPWEEIQVGSPSEIQKGEAYLHVDDVPDKKEYAAHPFDSHPVREVQDIQSDHFTPERLDQFATDLVNWKGSDHHKRWLETQKAAFAKDPEGYKKRGKAKPSPVYEGVPLQPQLTHIHNHPKKEKKTAAASTAAPAAPAVASASAVDAQLAAIKERASQGYRGGAIAVRKNPAAPVAPSQPTAVAPSATAAAPHPMEDSYQHYNALPDEHPMKKIYHGNPEFMQYLATKKGGNK